MATGGEALVAGLRALGVSVAFGLPGVHNLPAWRAFPDSGVRLVGVRHEQSAGYAADGYARATGRLGVALTTTGPGAANIVAAVGEAWCCHTPLLVIATDIPTTARRVGTYRGVLHETTDQASFFRPITKAQLRVERGQDVFATVLQAGRLALTGPARPVYLEIPTDLPAGATEETTAPAVPPRVPGVGRAAVAAQVTRAAALLAAPRRPLLWVGGGATSAGAGADLGALAQRLGAPVLSSFGGRGLLPPGHPNLVPLPPHMPAAGQLWDSADCVLVAGSDLDAMNTQGFRQPAPPALIAVDLAAPLANLDPQVQLRCDVQVGAAALLAALPGPDRTGWFTRPADRQVLAGPETQFLDALESGLPSDAVLLADMCIPGYWYAGFGQVHQPRGLAYPVGWGTLGFAFPAGLGAALSGRPAVALVGDGGFLFGCGELATAAQEQLPLTVVLVDDGGYGMLAYDFRKDGREPVGCDLEPPDFVALAQAFRVPAREVTVAELGPAVAAGIASGGPNLLVLRATFTPPPTTSPRWYRMLAGQPAG